MSVRWSSAVLVALLVAAASRGADLPRVVESMDAPRVTREGTLPVVTPGAGEEGGPSPTHAVFEIPILQASQTSRAWLCRVDAAALPGMDGLSFFVAGSGTGDHVQLLLRPVPAADGAITFRSRVLLRNPLWHRVFLPFSEFYDPSSTGTYPIRRFSAEGFEAVEIGLEVEGPTTEPLRFRLDSLGITSADEIRRVLGWRTFMPPSHGIPPYMERFEGPLRWTATGGATLRPAPLSKFPFEGFDAGLEVRLPDPGAAASLPLLPYEPLGYYEGFGFWIKGDGVDHVIELRLRGDDGRSFMFDTPVRGAEWKLVFAGFENFKIGTEPFEIGENRGATLSFSLDASTPAAATLTLGPFRLGYEK